MAAKGVDEFTYGDIVVVFRAPPAPDSLAASRYRYPVVNVAAPMPPGPVTTDTNTVPDPAAKRVDEAAAAAEWERIMYHSS